VLGDRASERLRAPLGDVYEPPGLAKEKYSEREQGPALSVTMPSSSSSSTGDRPLLSAPAARGTEGREGKRGEGG